MALALTLVLASLPALSMGLALTLAMAAVMGLGMVTAETLGLMTGESHIVVFTKSPACSSAAVQNRRAGFFACALGWVA